MVWNKSKRELNETFRWYNCFRTFTLIPPTDTIYFCSWPRPPSFKICKSTFTKKFRRACQKKCFVGIDFDVRPCLFLPILNIFNFIIAFLGLRILVKLLATPRALLMPTVAVLCVIGSFALRNNFFDVYVMLFFGFVGLAMRWLEMPVVPMLLALVLGRSLEENLRVALTSSKGDISIFFTSPISLTFLCLAALSIYWSLRSSRSKVDPYQKEPG